MRHPLRTALLAALALLAAAPAAALPLFSRDGADCARCHVGAVRLNAYGVRFLAAGLRLPGDSVAAPLPGHVPLSVTAEIGYALTSRDTLPASGVRGARNVGEFGLRALTLHAAIVGPRVTFRVAARLDSAGGELRLPQAWAQFALGAAGAFAVRAGVWDAGLPFLSAPLGGVRAEYLAPVAAPVAGVELRARGAEWAYGAGLVDSQRLPTDFATGAHGFNRLEDVEAWGVREWRGQFAGARALFDHQPSDISFHAFLQRIVVQVGGSFGGERWRVLPAYTLDRWDDRPAPGIHQRHQYALLEAHWLAGAQARWLVIARAEHGHVTPTDLTPGSDADRQALRLEYAVTPNARVGCELAHASDDAGGPRTLAADAAVRIAY